LEKSNVVSVWIEGIGNIFLAGIKGAVAREGLFELDASSRKLFTGTGDIVDRDSTRYG